MNQLQVYICLLPLNPPCHLPHHCRWSQSTGLNSLCHPANSFLLSTLHMVIYMFPCYSQIHPTLSLSNCICNRLSLYEDYCKICTYIQINTLLPLFFSLPSPFLYFHFIFFLTLNVYNSILSLFYFLTLQIIPRMPYFFLHTRASAFI